MKNKKPSDKSIPHGGSRKIASALQMPSSVYLEASHMELNGNREVIVDGCNGVLEYDSNVVRIRAGKRIVKFTGRDLNIKCMTVDSLIIEGFLIGIEFIT